MTESAFRRALALSFAITLIFCAVSFVWFDQPVALWFKANLVGIWSRIFHTLTDIGLGGVWLIPSGIFLIVFRWRQTAAQTFEGERAWRVAANASTYLFASVAGSGLLVDLLKGLIGRLRPRELFDHALYGFKPFSLDWAHTSFPSGHGQTVVAGFAALAFIWPRGRWLFAALAIPLAATRFIISVHYLSDVAMGAWFGAAGSAILARWFIRKGWAIRMELAELKAPRPPAP